MDAAEPIPVPDPVTVKGLAYALGIKPFYLFHELMVLNHFASLESELDFALATKVSAKFDRRIKNAGPG